MRCQFCSAEYDEKLNRCPNCGMRPEYADQPVRDVKSADPNVQKVKRGPFGWFWNACKHWGRGSGRACRREYLWFTIGALAFSFALMVAVTRPFVDSDVPSIYRLADGDCPPIDYFPYVGAAFCLILFAPIAIATIVRRLHDIGISGWFFLVFAAVQYVLVVCDLQPFMGILPLCLVAWPGKRGENEYGPNPRFISGTPDLGAQK